MSCLRGGLGVVVAAGRRGLDGLGAGGVSRRRAVAWLPGPVGVEDIGRVGSVDTCVLSLCALLLWYEAGVSRARAWWYGGVSWELVGSWSSATAPVPSAGGGEVHPFLLGVGSPRLVVCCPEWSPLGLLLRGMWQVGCRKAVSIKCLHSRCLYVRRASGGCRGQGGYVVLVCGCVWVCVSVGVWQVGRGHAPSRGCP